MVGFEVTPEASVNSFLFSSQLLHSFFALSLGRGQGAKRRRGGRRAKPARFLFVFLSYMRTRWESGKPALGFPLFHGVVAGAVGMWESRLLLARFPRGCGKRGKPAFGFPRFP